MNAKKIITLFVAAASLLALAGCGNSKTSKSKNENKTEKIADKSSKSSKWSFRGNTYRTSKLTFKITKVQIEDSSADGKKNIALYVDVTNNSKKGIEPSDDGYVYIHAYQKNATSNKQLNPGQSKLDENANDPHQREEDFMDNKLLPGKTGKGILIFELINNKPIKVTFENAAFETIGSKNYQAQ